MFEPRLSDTCPAEEDKGTVIMELFDGRPENLEGRLPREMRTYDLLDSLGIEYIRTDHEHALVGED